MSGPDSCLFFAAGLGTRMRPLTDTVPKPLIRVGGKPLLDHALDLGAHLSRRVANVHYLAAQIRDHLNGTGVLISDESDLLLDTGGGLRRAAPLLGPGAVFTMNTDAVWTGGNPFAELSAAWRSSRMGALVLLVPRDHATGYSAAGDFAIAPDGRITRGAGYVYTGAQIIGPAVLDSFTDAVFSMNRAWDKLIAEGRLFGALHTGGWCDVGRPDSIPLAEALLRELGEGRA